MQILSIHGILRLSDGKAATQENKTMRTLKTLILTISLLTASIASAQCPVGDFNCTYRQQLEDMGQRTEQSRRQFYCRQYYDRCTGQINHEHPDNASACRQLFNQCTLGSY